jgi:rsbT co-antagonist protein RsbR
VSSLSLEERLRRAEAVLSRVAAGDFDATLPVEEVSDDAIGGLEMGINFLIVDLRAAGRANEEKTRSLAEQQTALEERLAIITEQSEAIRRLSAPVMEVWDDILAIPIIGSLDLDRGQQIMETLLDKVIALRAKAVIVDLTGVDVVDTNTADHLLRITRSVALVGSYCVITGMSPGIAQTLVQLDADVTKLRSFRLLKDGIKECQRYVNSSSS